MSAPKDPIKEKLWRERQSLVHRKGGYLKRRWDNPIERKKLLEDRQKAITPELCNSRRETANDCWNNPEWRDRNIESHKKTYSDPEWKKRKGAILKERYKDPLLLDKMRKITTKRYEDFEERVKVTERLLGGFWYGNVRYPEQTFYCERWTKEFRNRCRANDGYKSVLSGITKEQNIVKGKAIELSVHHVYYQKKACCEWDEDMNGYYAMINLGTRRKPNYVRYDIKGDPNKFVILSHAENALVNFDKLKWIKFFEDLIESRGGKCYLTKEEMKKFTSSIA